MGVVSGKGEVVASGGGVVCSAEGDSSQHTSSPSQVDLCLIHNVVCTGCHCCVDSV